MVKSRVLYCNNSLGGNARRDLAPVHRPCILDVRPCNNVFACYINACKRLRYSKSFGRISSVQWRKFKSEESGGYFHCFLR